MSPTQNKIAILSPIAWRTPPRKYGPWEQVVALLTEGLVTRGWDVTLFATKDSITKAKLRGVSEVGYEEDPRVNSKVLECLHIAELFEHAQEFQLIHNNFDYLPLSYSKLVTTPLVTTIHGFSSPSILPVYRKYNSRCHYVSISLADRDPSLKYIANVYHGIELKKFTWQEKPEDYLVFFGRIHPDKGAKEAIMIAKQTRRRLIMAGIIQDQAYYDEWVKPQLNNPQIEFVGNVGPTQRDQLLGKAAALLHPINFAEPFGLSVIESMACGTPVIAFNKGSMSEIIIDRKTGFLVDNVPEAVAAVATLDSIQRADCRRHVEKNFTAERMVDDYIKVYETILAGT